MRTLGDPTSSVDGSDVPRSGPPSPSEPTGSAFLLLFCSLVHSKLPPVRAAARRRWSPCGQGQAGAKAALSPAGSVVGAVGDYVQTVVDLDATPAEAPALAERALDRLVREGIVRAGRTDCVLGAPLGNPPEEHWAKAVAEPDREPADGLDAEIGRTVFHGGQGGAHYAVCPQYDERTCFCTGTWKEIEGADEPFFAAIRT